MGRVVRYFISKKQENVYKKLLTWKDEIPTAKEYEKAVADGRKSGEDIIRFNDLNKEIFEDIILSIEHMTVEILESPYYK